MNPERAVGAGAPLRSWESLGDGEEGAEPPGRGAGAATRVASHGSHLCLLLQGSCSEPGQNIAWKELKKSSPGSGFIRGLSEQSHVCIS